MGKPEVQSVLQRLFEVLPEPSQQGHYEPEKQTWSHRDAQLMSPVKHNQEQ